MTVRQLALGYIQPRVFHPFTIILTTPILVNYKQGLKDTGHITNFPVKIQVL